MTDEELEKIRRSDDLTDWEVKMLNEIDRLRQEIELMRKESADQALERDLNA